jgi:predicted Rossmann fold flavoprotein
MDNQQIIVIGGGAAGLMAAGWAANDGARILVLEKMKSSGRKLCITGKGRCNITNIIDLPEFILHFDKQGKFLRQAFNQFFNTDLISFLHDLGLQTVTERGGRVFPASGKASDVRDVLLKWAQQRGAQIQYNTPVNRLILSDGRLTGVDSRGKTFPCSAVILATGGASYPTTGSTGDGYQLAADVGHSIIPIRPALVPLETGGEITSRMQELNLRNILVRLLVNNKKKQEIFGELVFTEFGVTGPTILTLSAAAVDAIRNGLQVTLSLDLKPALDEKKLESRLQRDIASRGNEQLTSLLGGLLPRQMIPVCLELNDLSGARTGNTVTAKERRRLRCWLKDFRLEVTGYRPFTEAIVTAGGVNTKEIDPRTMQSVLLPGLFIVGELLDIHGDTGGYNLQAAFSTGWLAGKAASSQLAT